MAKYMAVCRGKLPVCMWLEGHGLCNTDIWYNYNHV